MTTLWLDTETYSECDLKTAGVHRYAEHPSTEVIIAQWAIDDGAPHVEDTLLRNGSPSGTLVSLLEDPTVEIVAHKSDFDRTVIKHVWGLDIPVERWRDTLVQGLAHGLPGGLGAIGAVLGIEEDKLKDKRGKQLVQLFCKPRPKNMTLRRATRETHPAEWAEFLEYSRQDIVSMREIAKRMPKWNYPNNARELALWHLDQRINDRGFAVDTHLATMAVRAAGREKARLKAEIRGATGGAVTSASKRDVLLKYILEAYGVDLPDLQVDTLRRRAEDPELPEAVRTLVNIRLEDSKASVSKYSALLRSVSADERLRGTSQFCGAARTGRWAHRMFQPGNLKRPDMKADEIAEGIEAIKADCADLLYDDVMNLCANAVRGSIIAPPGKKIVVADLANIEGRGAAFLAGEEWKLQAFREYDAGTGPDLYKLAYARSFNVDPSEATGKKRQIGKVQELMLQYQGGVAAYLTGAATYNIDLDELADAVHGSAPKDALAQAYRMHEWTLQKKLSTHGLSQSVWVACEALKALWRAAHPAIVALWDALHHAFVMAVANPGTTVMAGKHLALRVDGAWMRMRLPSGRYLCYLQPKVKAQKDGRLELSYMGVNQYTKQWGRIKTYGGKTFENATQAWARDVLTYHMPDIEERGYLPLLTIHDELLTETPDSDDYTAEELGSMMSREIPWAKGCPLSAAGFQTYQYRKGD